MQRIKNSGKQYEIARRALSWVYFAKRPLRMEELQEALAVNLIWDIEEADEDCRDLDRDDIEKPQTIIESCGSLISWDRSTNVVGFSHYTVSEFFAVHVDGNIESETYIARTCLTYLCFEVFDKGPCGREELEERVNRYRLAPYVAKYFGKHVSGSKAEEGLQDLVLSILFSRSRSLAWLELDFNYRGCISRKSGRRNRDLHYSSYHDELYYGWEPLHFLSAWDIPFIMNRILSSSIPVIVDLMTAISHKWTRRFPRANGPIWHQDPDDLRLKSTVTYTSYLESEAGETVKAVTPLHVACRYGNAEIVKLLLSMSVDVDPVYGIDGVTPLYDAARRGDERIVKLLLEKDANMNASSRHLFTMNILEVAATWSHEGIIKLLLEKGVDVNGQGGYLGNALLGAAYRGHERIVKLLLEKGADVNAQGGHLGNALQGAAYQGHERIVKLLLEKGADVNAQGGLYGSALLGAATRGREGIVKLLLEEGAEVNAAGQIHGSALQAAANQGHERIVKLLLEKGAEVNGKQGRYGTALCGAASRGDEGIVKLLLEKGADVNAQGGEYGNALQAAASGRLHLISYSNSQRDEQRGCYGVAVWHPAACGNLERIVKLLLEKGAHVNAPGGVYGNALQAAVFNEHEDVVKLLKESGAVLT